ncbi:MAG: hypothetical protein HOV80_39015, partial [Polyangiaceae bacterium]|nr:hypothetical protein [Polyangiaceae bacterium]
DEKAEKESTEDKAEEKAEEKAEKAEASADDAEETKAAAEDEGDDESEDESDEADEAEEKAAAAPKKAKEPEAEAAAPDPAPERMRRARARGDRGASPPPPAASLGRSVALFVGVFVTLAAGFAFLSSSDPFSQNNAPKWRKGQKVQLNITLDPRDDLKLSCASKTVIEGKRCEFEAKNQKFAGPLDDKAMLRPYTTTDGVQFLAAGLWSQPDLEKGKRPRERFTVSCSLTVDGSVASPAIRWDPAGSWNEKNQSWFAGAVTDCKVQPDSN